MSEKSGTDFARAEYYDSITTALFALGGAFCTVASLVDDIERADEPDYDARRAARRATVGIERVLTVLQSQGKLIDTAARQALLGVGHLTSFLEYFPVVERTLPRLGGVLRLLHAEPITIFGLTQASAHEIAYHVCETMAYGVIGRALDKVEQQHPAACKSLKRIWGERSSYALRATYAACPDETSADGLLAALLWQAREITTITESNPALWPALACETRARLSNPEYARERQALLAGDHERLYAFLDKECAGLWGAAPAGGAPPTAPQSSDRMVYTDQTDGPFALLRETIEAERLVGNEARIINALCDTGGRTPLTKMAELCDWKVPCRNPWNAARIRLNRKIKMHGWQIETVGGAATARRISSSASARK